METECQRAARQGDREKFPTLLKKITSPSSSPNLTPTWSLFCATSGSAWVRTQTQARGRSRCRAFLLCVRCPVTLVTASRQ